jgi:ATP-binding cassette, subfamily B, bacterial
VTIDKHSDRHLLGRIFAQARPYWKHITGVLALNLLATPLSLLSPLPLKLVVDNLVGSEPWPTFLLPITPSQVLGSSTSMLLFCAVLLVILAVFDEIHSLALTFSHTYTGEKLALDFRSRLFQHGQRLSLAYHDKKGTTDALYRIQYDTTAITAVTVGGLVSLVGSFLMLISMIYVMGRINIQMAFIALLVAPLMVALTIAYRRPLRTRWRSQKRLDHAAMSVINEVFAALRVVKAFTQEDREQIRFQQRATESLSASLRVILLQGSFELAMSLAVATGTGIVLFIGVRSIWAGAMSVGDLIVVMSYLGMLYGPLTSIGRKLTSLQNAFASAERAFEFLDEEPDVPEKLNARELPRARGEFELSNVCFGYDPGQRVLQDISLKIPAGTKVGIAGRTGAGKSTLLSLLMRFYDPTEGTIKLDDVDLRDLRVSDLRQQYSIVLQEPVLFSTSIAENIAYGKPGASDDEIVAAAKSANAHEFIVELTDGYETLVGERGMRLSGGERQRISLARAFLRDAPILLLDEPTSAVDIKTEAIIMEVMERLMHGRTTFMIAHRLSTLSGCDLLLEVKGGRVDCVDTDMLHASGEPKIMVP